ncbi:hypothetical protein J6590_024214 [Homalodisca vitripennis]|nr:hypothetical protein J6590_024214 [Homalodisca vitripennis]
MTKILDINCHVGEKSWCSLLSQAKVRWTLAAEGVSSYNEKQCKVKNTEKKKKYIKLFKSVQLKE